MKDCIFCKIVKGESPCHKIYEDDFVLAFLDISNDTEGHTLVIPKKHYESTQTADGKTLSNVIGAVKKIGDHFVNDCGFDGYNVICATGQSAGQTVFHMHFHIIPRKFADGKDCFPHFDEGCKEPLADVAKRLKFEEEKDLEIDDENAVILYTDGACSGNPGPGGWSAILRFRGSEKILSGGEMETTNNRMELFAVIMGIEAVNKNVPIKVHSDSAYVVNAFHQHWIEGWLKSNWKNSSKEPVSNKDLWQRLLADLKGKDVEFVKVKGHADNEFNNRCDSLARDESERRKLELALSNEE